MKTKSLLLLANKQKQREQEVNKFSSEIVIKDTPIEKHLPLSTNIVRSKERIKQTGEVFTPIKLVDEILNKLPQDLFNDPTKTFIDPACGDGNFLVRVIAFKIQYGSTIQQALETTYGVDIMEDNVQACRERLLTLADNYDTECFGYTEIEKKYGHIVNKNIVCANALTYNFRF